ncbi:MAG TPA: DPP IV N-terminal domain-containing protein [Gemmatimonadaceae bacterium]|nr:DPP IV N-terminal domain-containing protein [Gemmatimonadaceae bacterium]
MRTLILTPIAAIVVASAAPTLLAAQGTAADYTRAERLNARFQGLALHVPERATWIGNTDHFWYRRSVQGGNEFVVVDAATKEKHPAFDHAKLAAALDSAAQTHFTATTLPFLDIALADDEHAVQFVAAGFNWRCTLTEYSCLRLTAATTGGRGGRGGPSVDDNGDVVPFEGPWDENDGLGAEVLQQRAEQFGGAQRADSVSRRSPDGAHEAFIQNYNVYVRDPGARAGTAMTTDGSEGSAYTLQSIAWSPDSRKIAVYRVTPGYRRIVRYVESSPTDQLQPKYMERVYAKPGDVLDLREPVLIDVANATATHVDHSAFPNAYQLSPFVWRKDGHAFTFEYNQRGHQVYRVIEVDAATAAPRVAIDEESKTFINYRRANGGLSDSGRQFRYDVADGKEIVWMSERDGWSHLYLYDGATGRVKNQITKGQWVVRAVDRVDEVKRQIWFEASGMNSKQDPYFTQFYRINFDGTGLTPLTDADGNHTVAWSADSTYYLDTYSRVDLAPVLTLHSTANPRATTEIERGDIAALSAAGWTPPDVFVAKGRDGTTDIWGVIFKPTNFDASKKYPVIENIYAGPQGSFVPKSFSVNNGMRNLAELGFIVVQIDGMGTNNRSKAFHDVAWHDLGDAGFPDRILWHKAVAAKFPWYDISRVGVYGTSAGGQNSLGALLFHPEFYKAAVSAAGCHDNRMDKIWWNEQWMGWPIGSQYAASSNVDNASKLQGDLMLIVGELDTNVDPSSTMQVVNALIKANKVFDLLVIPGADHTSGGPYGERKRNDFFVHHLLGVEPPERNAAQAVQAGRSGR